MGCIKTYILDKCIIEDEMDHSIIVFSGGGGKLG